MTTTIKNLTALNVRAINETITDARVTTTKTTATFDMTAAEAIALVGKTIDSLDGGNAHPRGSLHAVARKLENVAKAAGATIREITDAVETHAATINAADFDAMLAEVIAETTTDTTTTDTEDTMTDAADTINGVTATPTMRAVYDAMTARDASDCTAKDLEAATGIILAKVRAALQGLKAAGAVASTDQAKPGQAVTWWLTPATADDDHAADVAATDADINAGAEIDAAVDATGHLPGHDDNDTPAAPVADAPKADKPKRIRLLAAYASDPAPSTSAHAPGKTMARALAWMEANPGEHIIAEIAAGLDTKWTADVLKMMRRLAASDPRVTQVEGARKATFTFTPADAPADADADATADVDA